MRSEDLGLAGDLPDLLLAMVLSMAHGGLRR